MPDAPLKPPSALPELPELPDLPDRPDAAAHWPRAAWQPSGGWPAIDAARARDAGARLPFHVLDQGRPVPVGSVARDHLAALLALAGWADALQISGQAVTLRLPANERNAFFDSANQQLRQAGLVRAWRGETYPVLAASGQGPLLATIERAASRFWGTLTFGAHCNGYRAGPDGRPSHLWIARRAFDKAVDPGRLDNLIGGGVPWGQTPAETVVREGWEEAGLRAEQMQALRAGRRFTVLRDVPEGLQHEQVSVYDLALPAGLQPRNQDGEVHSLALMPLGQALAHAAAGDMTVDASLATLDFALRHRLLAANLHQHLRALCDGLWCGPASLGR